MVAPGYGGPVVAKKSANYTLSFILTKILRASHPSMFVVRQKFQKFDPTQVM